MSSCAVPLKLTPTPMIGVIMTPPPKSNEAPRGSE